MEYSTHNAGELRSVAAAYVAGLAPAAGGATLVTLSGELGAGKTTFVQGAAEALGVRETVASPTFVIEKVYALSGRAWGRLIHIDAYRLKGAHELAALRWEELMAARANLILLEWPERVPELIPESAIRVLIDIKGEGRIISIDHGEKSAEKN